MKDYNSDIDLFHLIHNGHSKAMAMLYDKYYEPLCNFAFLFLKDAKLTEEIVDDVFIHIWLKHETLTIHSNLRSYLYRSVRNGVVSYLRKNRPELIPVEILDSRHQLQNTPDTPESLMIRKEIASKVVHLTKQLPTQAGLVFRMHKMDGLRYKEIAEILEISVKTVENHMGRALKIFRLMYEENAHFFND